MARIRWIVALSWCLALLPGLCAAEATAPLRIVVEAGRPPFSERSPSGVLVGFDVSIAQALCREIGRPCLIVARPLAVAMETLQNGDADLFVAGLMPTAALREHFDFSDRYYRAASIYVGLSGTNSLKNKTVGVLTDSAQHAHVASEGQPFSSVRCSSSVESLWLMLLSGSVDVVLVDNLVAYGFLLSLRGRHYDFVGQPLVYENLAGSHHIALLKGQSALRDAVNQALLALRRNGEFIGISYKHFGIDIGY